MCEERNGAELSLGFSVSQQARFWNRSIVCFVSFVLTFNPSLSGAGVAVDASASIDNQASVTSAGNGVPIVNIVPPSAGGVSHNKFDQFDVGAKGMILNNSRGVIDTQLAGNIDGNPSLTGSAASIILNEVTSTKRSFLNGLVEVSGQQAEFVLANPNGISCSGCGFINIPRTTLSTGNPGVRDGSLYDFSVDGGDIYISSLNASNTDRLDLYARAI